MADMTHPDSPRAEETLVEGVEKLVVAALAQQDGFARYNGRTPHYPEPDSRKVTLEIIEAVADRLDERYGGHKRMLSASHVCGWIRAQAQEEGK